MALGTVNFVTGKQNNSSDSYHYVISHACLLTYLLTYTTEQIPS